MPDTTILVIEDDAAIRHGVVDALEYGGYRTLEAGEGNAGLELALKANCRLLLLDLVLPGRDGFSILAELKKKRPGQAVIILSARGEENDRVRGLGLGADDCVMKPFSVRELLARVEAVLRRTCERPAPAEERNLRGGRVDLTSGKIAFIDGGDALLSERETGLLRYLLDAAGRVVSRDVEKGSARAAPATLAVGDLVHPMIERFAGRLQEACMKLSCDPADPAWQLVVQADRAAVEHVLFNLIDNAAKYASGTTEVEIAAEPGRNRFSILVRDHGPGIPPSERKRVFRAFHKSAAAAAESRPGVGLGLALSRRLARAGGGELELRDTPPRHLLRFRTAVGKTRLMPGSANPCPIGMEPMPKFYFREGSPSLIHSCQSSALSGPTPAP